ncbi:DUF3618 domain-containing protein [Streptomyces sp. GC420]|uniref:DUF3618 domain-containing protein n=1 Tax=Streptomyces sp. GC420 TaxID=2697568 RepID=UPI001D3F12C3|nr:DUF3618 domain-containing protein [Streptomyces sp. GC420]
MTRHQDPTKAARARVEEARERLGETVGELAAKTDVKARARERATEVRTQVRAQVQDTASKTVHLVQEKTPEPVRKAADTGRRHPGLLIAAGTAVLMTAMLVKSSAGGATRTRTHTRTHTRAHSTRPGLRRQAHTHRLGRCRH